jgi:ATP-dependent protease ClpP protease subunit
MSDLNTGAGNRDERWIRFEGGVNQKSGATLTRAVDHYVANGVKKIHLMMNSLGGEVFAGQAAFNQIRIRGVEVDTYNIGSVQSMAVLLFCAGARRYCLPNSIFMIHPVQWIGKEGQVLVSKGLREAADFCDTHTRNIAYALAPEIGKKPEEVLADMGNTRNFNAEESKAYGFVHEILEPDFFPPDAAYTLIEEDGSVREYPAKQRMDPFIENLLAGKTLNLPTIPTYAPNIKPTNN